MYDFGCGESGPLLPGSYDTENRDVGTLFTDVLGFVSAIVGIVEFVTGTGGGIVMQLVAFCLPLAGGFLWAKQCLENKEGVQACMAGIVDSISAPQASNFPGSFEDFGGWAIDAAEKNEWFPFLQGSSQLHAGREVQILEPASIRCGISMVQPK